MTDSYTNEPMLDMFIFETTQLIEQLEQVILTSEKAGCFTQPAIHEIFRIMHTIKGSSAMMMFSNISVMAHSMEDLFYFLREEKPKNVNCASLSDLLLNGVDFIKEEVEKIKSGTEPDGEAVSLISAIKSFLSVLKEDNRSQTTDAVSAPEEEERQQFFILPDKPAAVSSSNIYKAVISFEEGCEMENIRAYTVIHNLKDITGEIWYVPEDIIDNDNCIEIIRKDGFKIYFKSDRTYDEMHNFFMQTIFLRDLEFVQLENDEEFKSLYKSNDMPSHEYQPKVPQINDEERSEKLTSEKENQAFGTGQSIISVNVMKLDKLMDLVGEMVIAEAMVIQNPDLKGLELDNFHKAARQLNKITSELQDVVMSIRMVPLSTTFHKMHRIVRDMCKKLGKDVQLEIIGEETEVDKNIIEHISDPLMHLVRNSLDHGIETSQERMEKGKDPKGTITLEAKNSGSDVLVIVRDDGRGLNREKILRKARENGLLYKAESEMTDAEVFNLIFLPGFSTKESVSEFSGRGVGMDVVTKNIESVGGSVSVDSTFDRGTTITLKIPLTLAIIDGMNIKVGKSHYTISTIAIKESFRPEARDIITDPDGNEMIMVRGQCYPILRLHQVYKVKTEVISFEEGIILMIEQDGKTLCVLADELLGQQQVVVKALPEYIRKFKKVTGLAGCTLLGDGSISLILDPIGLMNLI